MFALPYGAGQLGVADMDGDGRIDLVFPATDAKNRTSLHVWYTVVDSPAPPPPPRAPPAPSAPPAPAAASRCGGAADALPPSNDALCSQPAGATLRFDRRAFALPKGWRPPPPPTPAAGAAPTTAALRRSRSAISTSTATPTSSSRSSRRQRTTTAPPPMTRRRASPTRRAWWWCTTTRACAVLLATRCRSWRRDGRPTLTPMASSGCRCWRARRRRRGSTCTTTACGTC